MDDPWGSPWAIDEPPKLDLPNLSSPTPPGKAHRREASPKDSSFLDDEAWGGWNDAVTAADSPGWGRSPALKPLDEGGEAWATRAGSDVALEEREVVDSAISMGELPRKDDDHLGDRILDDTASLSPQVAADDTVNAEAEPQLSTNEAIDGPLADDEEGPQSEEPSELETPILEQRPEPTRQSSKVQELVEMYDGIANRVATPPTAPEHEPRQKNEDEGLDQDGASQVATRLSFDSEQAEVEDEEEAHSETSSTKAESPAQQQVNEAVEHPRSIDQLPGLHFDTDLSHLDTLFPGIDASFPEPEPLPDSIIGDTFTTVAERKAWYAMSRQGSIRKHTLGSDDDNYVHITWGSAHIRLETLKIVRRWMEEDSIAGKVVWGRKKGAVGVHMFNWDSDAPQVEIGELFGRRKVSRDRQSSVSTKDVGESPTVAAFGWSSSVPSSPTTVIPQSPEAPRPNGHVTSPKDPRISAVKSTSQRPQSWSGALLPPPSAKILPEPRASPALPKAVEEEAEDDDDDDDDDDWGEMVSSPTDAGFGVIEAKSIDAQLDCIVAEAPILGSESPQPKRAVLDVQEGEPEKELSTAALSELCDSRDDEVVAEILHNLPDLTYMLQ